MRDDQVRRYARHIMLPDVGRLGQTALMAASARLVLGDSEPTAELIAGEYLAAGGVGTLVAAGATEQQRAELAARGADTKVVAEGDGRGVEIAARPAWWPSAPGDATALAFWRGGVAAALWMTAVVRG